MPTLGFFKNCFLKNQIERRSIFRRKKHSHVGDSGLPSGPPGLPCGRAPSRLRGAALPSRLWVPVFFGMRVLRWGQGRGSRPTCDVGGTACHPRPWPLGQLFPGLCPDGPAGGLCAPRLLVVGGVRPFKVAPQEDPCAPSQSASGAYGDLSLHFIKVHIWSRWRRLSGGVAQSGPSGSCRCSG